MGEILAAIAAIQTLIKIIDELEARGATLTPDMRKSREEQRGALNSLWAAHLEFHRQQNPGVPDPQFPEG